MKTITNAKQPGKTILADLGLLYASAIWGSTFIMVKNSLDSLDPVTLVAYRFLLAALLMGGYLILTRQPLFRNFFPGLVLGFIQMFLYIPQTIGLQFTTAANSGFITGLFVAFVPPLSLLIPKQRPRPAQWAAVAISLLGLWLVTGGISAVNRGDLFTLSAAFTYALHVMLTDRYAKGISNHLQLVFQQFLVVGLLSLLVSVVFDLPLSVPNLKAGGVIVFLGLFPTLSAYLIQIKAQVIASPIRVSLIFALEPVFAAIFAWTVGGELFKPLNALGGLLIFMAVVLGTVHFPSDSDNSLPEGVP
jgi:drug/metabolite transporter (DMT)-like permease